MGAILYKDKVYGAGGSGGGASAVSDLTDVELDNLSNGQVLKYNNTSQKWENANESGGSAEMLAPTPFIYSESEEQVGIFIDGKPLYQKTINFGTLPNNTGKSVAHGASNIDAVVNITGYGKVGSSYTPMPYVALQNINGVQITADATNININTAANRSSWTAYITIKYTKTTDTPWQGGFKAYGFTPVIYSKEEREVGVYEDGKPLYQKTIDVNVSVSSLNTWFYTGVTIANADKCIFVVSLDSSGQTHPTNGAFSANKEVAIAFGSIATSGTRNIKKVTLQYTKTTDTAGSGKYTTLGTPAVHYDDVERIVGTWFGETLWQKTFSGLSLGVPSMSWVDTGKAIADGKKCVNVVCNASTASISAIGDIRPNENGKIYLMGMRNATVTLTEFTIQYTKTS